GLPELPQASQGPRSHRSLEKGRRADQIFFAYALVPRGINPLQTNLSCSPKDCISNWRWPAEARPPCGSQLAAKDGFRFSIGHWGGQIDGACCLPWRVDLRPRCLECRSGRESGIRAFNRKVRAGHFGTFGFKLVAVVFPLQAKYLCTMRHAQIVVLAVWGLSVLLAAPIFFVIDHSNPRRIIAYEMYMLTLLFLLPLLVMILAYTVIGVKVWRVSEFRTGGRVISTPSEARQRVVPKSDSGERVLLGNGTRPKNCRGKRQAGEEIETRKQVVGMLVMVVLLFTICWGPVLINNVLTAWGHLHQFHYGFLKPMRQAFFLLSYFNSCVNPIVYAFFSRNFRQSFRIAICACLKGKAFVRAYRYSISAASTRTSAIHFNGRAMTSVTEKDSSGNDVTRSPTSYAADDLELQKMT
ncbi:hypothetical protein BaRGS_00012886, partial [Batillaria attramentaria]